VQDSPQALARPAVEQAELTQGTDLLALFAGVASTTPVAAWSVPTPLTTTSSSTGLVVSGVATAPAPTQRLSHALGGYAAPSRHTPAVSAATAPLAKSPGQGLCGPNALSTPGDKGKDAMEIHEANIGNLTDGLVMEI